MHTRSMTPGLSEPPSRSEISITSLPSNGGDDTEPELWESPNLYTHLFGICSSSQRTDRSDRTVHVRRSGERCAFDATPQLQGAGESSATTNPALTNLDGNCEESCSEVDGSGDDGSNSRIRTETAAINIMGSIERDPLRALAMDVSWMREPRRPVPLEDFDPCPREEKVFQLRQVKTHMSVAELVSYLGMLA